MDIPGIESRWGEGEIFRNPPDGPGPPWVKRPGRGVDYLPQPSAEVNERVELYIYSHSGPSWPVLGRTLLLPLPLELKKYIYYQHQCSVFGSKSKFMLVHKKHVTELGYYVINTSHDGKVTE